MKKIEIPNVHIDTVERAAIAPISFALWAGHPVLKDTEAGPVMMIGNTLFSDVGEWSASCMAEVPFGGYVSPGDDLLEAVQNRIPQFQHTDTRVHRMLELAAELSMSEQDDKFQRGGMWGWLPSPFSPMPSFRTVARAILTALSAEEKMQLIALHRFKLPDGSTRIVASATGKTNDKSVVITLEDQEPALIVHHEFGGGIDQIEWHEQQLPQEWNKEEIGRSIYAVMNREVTTENLF